MQPPITADTILQNRYRITRILGQGGFGRTYLAQDQRRFNELCAIKELIPTVIGGYAWEKAKELFQREAAILYQIQHQQVPQFRERFEQEQRLFLVQDYVAGKTYRTLLDERQATGSTFTEEEVLQLMRSLLPVLEHLHHQGIIHRDISPDNIILRETDHLPVLIDFGVVKELATKLKSPEHTMPATTVGKYGYAPTEQIQTGRTYPSSDLYALAVTAIVLLSGKEPQDLFDEHQLTWNWQRFVTINSQFASVLNRMLSQKVGDSFAAAQSADRYPNATDVLQALQAPQQANVSTSYVSNVQTLAVGRRPEQAQPSASNKPNEPNPAIPQQSSRSLLDNPFAVFAITIVVIVVAGFSSWAVVRSIRSQSQVTAPNTDPQTFPSPVIPNETALTPTPTSTPTTTSTPTPTPTNNEPVVYSKRLNFGTSNTADVNGTIKANQIVQYKFFGQQGQQLTVLLTQQSSVLLSVLGPNQEPVDNPTKDSSFFQQKLPLTGRYIIQVRPVLGQSESNYNLSLELENSVKPTPTPTEVSPSPTPTPTEVSPSPTPTPTEVSPSPIPTPTEVSPSSTPTPTEQPSIVPPVEQQNNPPASETPNSAPDQTDLPPRL
ncbi:serine/threonine-protein kinase [Brasilonema sp. UFV-L1]|uniref:serine/threonine-protein kinase n=1 Tax=Brasilonema sp. UFV-L1 TaxID=2234130 RepID=UPI00145F2369|nr:serine/threonine-protein kinase [Brasilonema sp. UFV-L1]NMG06310.1 serine/threonine protein kinase [Brasilonema sp. UFV-L1]